MEWCRSSIEFTCCRCGKAVKPGCKVGLYQGRLYCWHCGHNIELASDHRFVSKVNKEMACRMRSI